MKQLTTTLAVLTIMISSLFAQSPQAFNYQTIVRDATGNIVVNQAVSFQLSILEDNATGTVAYSETHSATTNEIGLANLQIGTGTVVSGTFAGIDWPNHDHFLKVEFDATGGTTYDLMGTSQLLSVPYALHAETVSNDLDEQDLSTNGDTIFISNGDFVVIPGLSLVSSLIPPVQQRLDGGETPKEIFDSGIPLDSLYGKTYTGGLIFYLNITTGAGLVAAPSDQSNAEWGCYGTDLLNVPNVPCCTPLGPGAEIGDGESNTDSIIVSCSELGIAAKVARAYDDGSWYLPSAEELNQMYINLHANGLGGIAFANYWSSTEANSDAAWTQNFFNGDQFIDSKSYIFRVRAVRAF